MTKMLLAEDLECAETEAFVLIQDCQPSFQKTPVFWPVAPPDSVNGRLSDFVKYIHEPECLTILTQREWQLIFSSQQITHSVRTADENIRLLVEILRESGIKAGIKVYGDDYYLVIFGYPDIVRCFTENTNNMMINHQRLRIGIAGLSTDWGETTSVHVLALVDVIAGDAIPDIQYLLNDEQLLHSGGIKQALMIANAIIDVSTLLLSDEYFPVSKALNLGLMLVSVALPVNISEKCKEYFSVQVITFAYHMIMSYEDSLV